MLAHCTQQSGCENGRASLACLELGKVFSIDFASGGRRNDGNMDMMLAGGSTRGSSSEMPIESGLVAVSTTVNVRWLTS